MEELGKGVNCRTIHRTGHTGLVGRTPWSAAGPLAGLFGPHSRTGRSGADQGVRPTNIPRQPSS